MANLNGSFPSSASFSGVFAAVSAAGVVIDGVERWFSGSSCWEHPDGPDVNCTECYDLTSPPILQSTVEEVAGVEEVTGRESVAEETGDIECDHSGACSCALPDDVDVDEETGHVIVFVSGVDDNGDDGEWHEVGQKEPYETEKERNDKERKEKDRKEKERKEQEREDEERKKREKKREKEEKKRENEEKKREEEEQAAKELAKKKESEQAAAMIAAHTKDTSCIRTEKSADQTATLAATIFPYLLEKKKSVTKVSDMPIDTNGYVNVLISPFGSIVAYLLRLRYILATNETDVDSLRQQLNTAKLKRHMAMKECESLATLDEVRASIAERKTDKDQAARAEYFVTLFTQHRHSLDECDKNVKNLENQIREADDTRATNVTEIEKIDLLLSIFKITSKDSAETRAKRIEAVKNTFQTSLSAKNDNTAAERHEQVNATNEARAVAGASEEETKANREALAALL